VTQIWLYRRRYRWMEGNCFRKNKILYKSRC